MVCSIRRLWALGIAVAAVVIMLAIVPRAASANHEDCSIVVNEPFLAYGIYAWATTSVECQSTKNTITISAELLRDGVAVDSIVERCHRCPEWFAYLIENDAAGDQNWCFRVSVRVNPHQIGPVTRCASF